jgi:uncharacterized protein (TIGR02145 family)
MATGCKKNDFGGGETGNYIADCRQNEGYGDLYSWEAVNRYQVVLCPNGWQVPTTDDFFALDTVLGGEGKNITPSEPTLLNAYLNEWGASYGGYCNSSNGGTISQQGSIAHYWSKSHFGVAFGVDSSYELELSTTRIYPKTLNGKNLGLMVRCVRNK